MTYQRNKLGSDDRGGAEGMSWLQLQDPLDYGVPDRVEEPQIGPGDDHEPERHRGALADLAAIGPLDAAQLEVGRAQEVRGAPEEPLARLGRVLVVLVVAIAVAEVALGAPRGVRWHRAGLGEMGFRHIGHRLAE